MLNNLTQYDPRQYKTNEEQLIIKIVQSPDLPNFRKSCHKKVVTGESGGTPEDTTDEKDQAKQKAPKEFDMKLTTHGRENSTLSSGRKASENLMNKQFGMQNDSFFNDVVSARLGSSDLSKQNGGNSQQNSHYCSQFSVANLPKPINNNLPLMYI